MFIAITFCRQAEDKCQQDKNQDALFARRENKPLSESIEFETPGPLFQFPESSACQCRIRSDRKFPLIFC